MGIDGASVLLQERAGIGISRVVPGRPRQLGLAQRCLTAGRIRRHRGRAADALADEAGFRVGHGHWDVAAMRAALAARAHGLQRPRPGVGGPLQPEHSSDGCRGALGHAQQALSGWIGLRAGHHGLGVLGRLRESGGQILGRSGPGVEVGLQFFVPRGHGAESVKTI